MFKTFSYSDGEILIASKIWSDFMAHIPLIRSFSEGQNIPLEYPLFSNMPIRYHFGFYFLVGLLEWIGFRIDIALNSLSIIGFSGLLISIYLLSKHLFKSRVAAGLAVLFTCFNSSLSWVYYFSDFGFDIKGITTNTNFVSFGPYDNQILSAFWNLNIYSNQRHLAFSFLLMFIAIYLIYYSKSKWTWLVGVAIIGLMSITHKAVLVITLGILLVAMVLDKEKRIRVVRSLIIGGLLTIPGLEFLNQGGIVGETSVRFQPGFLYNSAQWQELGVNSNTFKWIGYWLVNLGILIPLTILSYFSDVFGQNLAKFSNKQSIFSKVNVSILFDSVFDKKYIWLYSAICIFIISNLFAFASDISTSHKLINFSVFIFNIYAAIFIIKIFKKSIYHKILSVLLVFFMIFGGIIDIFPVINDTKGSIQDIQNNSVSTWIVNNTKPNERFFNLTYEVMPINITGRRIYFGWDYFTWSIGYPTIPRRSEIQNIATAKTTREEACEYLVENNQDYIFINPNHTEFAEIKVEVDFFDDNFDLIFEEANSAKIYDINTSCS